MTLAGGALRDDRAKQALTRGAAVVCATVALFVFVDHPGPYPTTMFLPPIGVVFGYLLLRGPAGIAVTTVALLLGNAIAFPLQFAANPRAEVASAVLLSVLLAITAYPLHRLRRRTNLNGPAFGVLTRFVLTGLLAAPLLTAAGIWALALLIGPPLQGADLARMVLGVATAIAALTPASVVGAVLLIGNPPAALRTRLEERRDALVPAAVILLAPMLALALPGARASELWLLPLAAVPLLWICGVGDLVGSASVLAICALALGTLARAFFGDDTELYTAQLMVLGCSLATLYVAATCLTETAARRQEHSATRWRALLTAAPAQVSRIAADGSWQSQFDRADDDQADDETAGAALPEQQRAEVAAAIRDRHPRTLHWQTSEAVPHSFVTRITPLPDGETLVVTTETTMAAVHAAITATTSPEREAATVEGLSIRTASEHARLISDVAAAVERDELEVVYQPDVHPERGTLRGLEALIRWRRRDGVGPADFVRLTEEAGTAPALDDWVICAALAQFGAWRREIELTDLELGINVSAVSLTSDLPARLDDVCRRNDVPPRLVRLAVAEAALGDGGAAVDVLRALRALGFRIGLGDFGTGSASLSRLRTLPIDVITLDRSFLVTIAEDLAAQTLVEMILSLAEPLQLDVVVEGVATQAQCDVLVKLGCQRVQGPLFSAPAKAAAIREILLAAGYDGVWSPTRPARIASQITLPSPAPLTTASAQWISQPATPSGRPEA